MANVFTNAVLFNLEAQQKGQSNKEMLDEKARQNIANFE